MEGTLISIHICEEAGGALRSLQQAELVAGGGIVGDRNYRNHEQVPDQELTLVESEQIERFNAETGLSIEAFETRRNIVTRGVSLNDLVGERFLVGDVEVLGMRLCEPCKYLSDLLVSKLGRADVTAPEIVAGLTHRAGLRARILSGGTVRVGDPIRLKSVG